MLYVEEVLAVERFTARKGAKRGVDVLKDTYAEEDLSDEPYEREHVQVLRASHRASRITTERSSRGASNLQMDSHDSGRGIVIAKKGASAVQRTQMTQREERHKAKGRDIRVLAQVAFFGSHQHASSDVQYSRISKYITSAHLCLRVAEFKGLLRNPAHECNSSDNYLAIPYPKDSDWLKSLDICPDQTGDPHMEHFSRDDDFEREIVTDGPL